MPIAKFLDRYNPDREPIRISASDLRATFIGTYVAGVGDYITLMKPRVMSLAVFTALVGFFSALGERPAHFRQS